ncbi:hypothetical protein GCM10027186_57570 [Micromonospora schwarzwaldensis]
MLSHCWLALLATDWAEEDIPLTQTIGLLSHRFGPLAAEALRRRRGGGQALLWLAQRVAGWGRVYVIEALCQHGAYASRRWLLRHACDGDYLNGYFVVDVGFAEIVRQLTEAARADAKPARTRSRSTRSDAAARQIGQCSPSPTFRQATRRSAMGPVPAPSGDMPK